MDKVALQQLLDMGFPEKKATKALKENRFVYSARLYYFKYFNLPGIFLKCCLSAKIWNRLLGHGMLSLIPCILFQRMSAEDSIQWLLEHSDDEDEEDEPAAAQSSQSTQQANTGTEGDQQVHACILCLSLYESTLSYLYNDHMYTRRYIVIM